MVSVLYRLAFPAPATHLVHVELVLATDGGPLPDAIVVSLPVWTPGSYLIREYARHIEALAAEAPARARKTRKNAWRVETGAAARCVVRYRVYAGELTVRTNHVDDGHAFLVGSALLLAVEGSESAPADIEIALPPAWRAFTPLARLSAGPDPRVVRFRAPDYDTLVDSPIELGAYREERFDVLGKPHRYAICPAHTVAPADLERLASDTRTIIETEARLFGSGLPYASYDLVLHFSQRGRGGLEHRSSAALIAGTGSFATREGYLDLLSLVAHEVFHAWNVKRIRPSGLTPYRYDAECYTRLLWWFEGGTSYYDWRVLCLSHLCSVDEYLDHLAQEIAYLDQTPGRLVHALEDASYDAWIKLYRPDENSANSSVSYYRKGEVVCALLDLEIRARSGGRASLDAVLVRLWQLHGATERPVPEDAMQAIIEDVAGAPLSDLFDAWIRSATEIDYAATFAHVGLVLERSARSDAAPCSLGVKLRGDGGRAFVSSVLRDGAAWRAGIDAGDEILAVDGLRLDGVSLDPALRARSAGERVEVLVSRDGRVASKPVVLDPGRTDRVKLVPAKDAPPQARDAFAAWLEQPQTSARPRGGA
ncbi:MAG: PDZ domain-containing protein [Polyangiaceae bacterium]|nr:PDZ domain-containing protein [Polyangiaceae bacterium]